ncbi:uncharacterized protein LOC120848513 [Ixodes scapularis]|uniref:uncharacterized protein LOC120848513 n=1 Tax=Ixodes scapularis TaxID=6945 RepID=UPI001A9E91A6|nr:uncharacterized protein LOC120848513 [Ixodes scapularis]
MFLAALLVGFLRFLVQRFHVLRLLVPLGSASRRQMFMVVAHPRHVLLRHALTELFATFLGLQTRLLFHLMVQVLHCLDLGTAALCQTPVQAADQHGPPLWTPMQALRLQCMSPQLILRLIVFRVLVLSPKVQLRLIQLPRPPRMLFLVHHHAHRHHT